MRVGIIQSNYIPWRGYFDFIHDCDMFILHDDIQYTKGDWRNRNTIKTPRGPQWLTVPVHYDHTAQLIQDTRIDHRRAWQKKHLNALWENYRDAPYVNDAISLFPQLHKAYTISELNEFLIRQVADYLGIDTPILRSRNFGLDPALKKTDRILVMCAAVGATHYLSGPAAKVYLDEEKLRQVGIVTEYKVYSYSDYPQLHGRFMPQVSVMDLIANIGPDAPRYIWGGKR